METLNNLHLTHTSEIIVAAVGFGIVVALLIANIISLNNHYKN
ncbi:hypothetical protein SAMN05192545_3958 [Maribacter dokdonensis]|uniref:Uncharacterized protein n=1 Tax=Maribacter dokdonensis TaxID=320912 RepID=A0ABY0V0T6_9FLAO|nr:hypothetical protein SAMN05192545_3958 [Maribacter dokdonensis]